MINYLKRLLSLILIAKYTYQKRLNKDQYELNYK